VPAGRRPEFTIIGKGKPRLDMPEKVDGSLKYGSDVVLPGMLYAVVARPPAFGATFVSVDDAACRAVDDVVDVVTIPQGVAVVARSTWAALQGRAALKITWDSSASAGLSSEALYEEFRGLVRTPGRQFENTGDVDAALTGAAKRVEAEYSFPFMDHAVMEPLVATAHVKDGKVELWVPTQVPTASQQTAARIAGVQPGDSHRARAAGRQRLRPAPEHRRHRHGGGSGEAVVSAGAGVVFARRRDSQWRLPAAVASHVAGWVGRERQAGRVELPRRRRRRAGPGGVGRGQPRLHRPEHPRRVPREAHPRASRRVAERRLHTPPASWSSASSTNWRTPPARIRSHSGWRTCRLGSCGSA